MSDSEDKVSNNYSLKPPKLHEYYKKVLVEELALMPDLYDLHNGNCSVIGKTRIEENGDFYLENIKTTYLDNKYLFPEGTFSVRIHYHLFRELIPDGKTAEIYGKVVLYDKINHENNRLPFTTGDMHVKLVNFINEEMNKDPNANIDDLKNIFNEKIKKIYEPAIFLRFMQVVDLAPELIEANLQIRMLCENN